MQPGELPIDYSKFIHRDPRICGGVPVFVGTRVQLSIVLANLRHGYSPEAILKDYPTLRPEHITAAIAFAADSAGKDLPRNAVPKVA
jgi:uncharacterized protein (DUF433 family)